MTFLQPDSLKRLQSGDKACILNAGEVTIVQVDPIRGKLIVSKLTFYIIYRMSSVEVLSIFDP